jgi:hypothetical protein
MNTPEANHRQLRRDQRSAATRDRLALGRRRLTFEPLESRELLSVSALGTPSLASTQTSSSHINAAVATNSDGESVVVWQSQNQASSDSGYDIYAMRYDADGNALGTEFLVNTYTTNDQTVPVVAMADDGSFVVAWQSSKQPLSGTTATTYTSIRAQRFDTAGSAVGSEFLVNTAAGSKYTPAIAMASGGEFVIAWYAYGQDGSGNGVYAKRYDASGNARTVPGTTSTTEFRVNTYVTGNQHYAAVAMDSSGNFVITWQSQNQVGSSSGFDVYAQRYDAAGYTLGSEFLVNTYTTGDQAYTAVAMDSAGDFVVTWSSSGGQDGSYTGIYAQRYNASGVAQGAEFQVNTSAYDYQSYPSIACDADGNFTIVWQSNSVVNGAESCAYAIFAQRYRADGTAWGGEVAVSGSAGYAQTLAAAAVDGSGRLVVAWQAIRSDGTSTDIYALRTTPIATADEYEAVVNEALSIDAASGVLTNDYFTGDSITVTGVTGPSKGSVSLAADGSFTYTPNANVAGTDTFTYRVLVGDEYSTVVKVTIVVVDTDALATIAARLYSQAMEGASSSPAKVSALLAKMNTDGSFIDYDYSGTTDDSSDDYRAHASNLTILVRAYQYNSSGNAWYHSATLWERILAGFNYLASAVGMASVPNWWDLQCSMSNTLWKAMVPVRSLLGDTLVGTLLDKYYDAVTRPVWAPSEVSGKNAGYNLAARATAALAEGLLRNDSVYFSKRIAEIVDVVSNDVAGGSATGDGLQVDYSEHQHNSTTYGIDQFYSGSYGSDYAVSLAYLLVWLNDTSYAISDTTRDAVVAYVLDGQQWLLWGDNFEITCLGRAMTRPNNVTSRYSATVSTAAECLLSLGVRTDELQDLIDRIDSGVTSTNYLSGNKAFWTSDAMVQQRAGYMAAVRMLSSRTMRPETLSGEGLQSYYLGDGFTTIYVTGDEYGTGSNDIFPVWNWQQLAGTTVEQTATMPTSSDLSSTTVDQYTGTTTFVGSVSDGEYGLAAMDYARSVVNVTAHKTWFYFDEGFVALGANIDAADADYNVVTTLNQVMLNTDVTIQLADGSEITFGNGTTLTLTNPQWILQDQIGYVLLGDNGTVVVETETRTGDWSDIGTSSGSVTADVFTAYVDHGVAPEDGSYAYLVLANATTESLDLYSSGSSPLVVLSNTEQIQAVQQTAKGITQIAFYEAGSLDIGSDLTVTVDQACLVMIREMSDGTVEVTVSDPTQLLSTIHVTLTGRFSGDGTTFNADQQTTVLEVTLPTGDYAGESVVNILAPKTWTVAVGSPSTSTVSSGSVSYTVTYAQADFNASTLSAADIALNSTGTATGTLTVTGSGLTRTVTISNITGNGTLGISIAARTASDTYGYLAPGSGTSATFVVDTTTPTGHVEALASLSSSTTFTVSVTGEDSISGGQASGVVSYDVYVAVDSAAFGSTPYTTVSADSPSFTFTASEMHYYSFACVARDAAGNVEARPTASETCTYVGDLTAPTTQITTLDASTSTFTLTWSGSDNHSLSSVSIYVQVDDGTSTLVGSYAGGTASGGVYGGTATYSALVDGLSHTYAFFIVGTDRSGNTEATHASADQTVTCTFACPAALEVTGLVLNNNASLTQRSYIRYADITFSRSDSLLTDVVNGTNSCGLTLYWKGTDGTQSVAVALSSATAVAVNGSTIMIDFGSSGITTNLIIPGVTKPSSKLSQSSYGDGYWALDVSIAGTHTLLYFSRLFGDLNGTLAVDQADLTQVIAGVNQTAPSAATGQRVTILNNDVDGSGKVDLTDRTYVLTAKAKAAKLATPLWELAAQEVEGGEIATAADVVALTAFQLQPLVAAAIARWQATGLTAEELAILQGLTYSIVVLPGAAVGLYGDGVVYLDPTAQGHGWFIDLTPYQDEEFSAVGSYGPACATATSPAAGLVDLISVLAHEMGHALGFDHDAAILGEVMVATLGEGERTLAQPVALVTSPIESRTPALRSMPRKAVETNVNLTCQVRDELLAAWPLEQRWDTEHVLASPGLLQRRGRMEAELPSLGSDRRWELLQEGL